MTAMDETRATGRWVRLDRRIAYDNAWIEVAHDDVVRPDGERGVYGVVHFKNRAVGVVALDDAGRVLLVGQDRYTLGAYSWEIPEGGVPFDEDPLEGARRELAEETGYRASDWRPMLTLHTSNSVTDEWGIVYRAAGLTAGAPAPEGTERIDVRWVSLDEALAMIDDGRITDAISQIGLLRVALTRALGEAGEGA
jgi:8-oxo-dGTP pyrophosphatase MutT (NUDIX family)